MNTSYINYLKGDQKSPNTIKAYTKYITEMLAFINKPDTSITYADLLDWKAHISNHASATVCLEIAAIRSYFSFLEDIDIITHSPADKLKPPKRQNKEKPYIDTPSIRALINAARTLRDKAVILTFCATGLRVSELSSITLAQFYNARITREVTIVGKGDKERTVYLNDEVMATIEAYLETRDDDCEYLFTTFRGTKLDADSFSQTIKMTARRAGLACWKEMSNHTLRACFATSQSELGTPIADIQASMGHASLSTTSVYIKHSQARINRAMAQSAF